jgi:hypothetical protein
METNEKELKERMDKAWSTFEAMCDVVPKSVSLKEVTAAATLLIADCITQADLNEEEKEVFCNSIPDKVRAAVELLKEASK